MTTIAECLARSNELDFVSDSARLDVELLLADCLQKNRTYLYTWPEKQLTTAELELFSGLFTRRLGGEPVAYLLGYREFWSLRLQVNSSTLIPRPDTEKLVEVALSLVLPTHSKVLDLGTGTGAIALALAVERPQWQVWAVDKSAQAVELARTNAKLNGLTEVQLLLSHWFSSVSTLTFDLIVSNPPYIDPVDPHLLQGDVRFEPRSALVAEDVGFADLFTIAKQSWQQLQAGGWLVLEHGYQQAKPLQKYLLSLGYMAITTEQDYGGNDRVTFAQKPETAQ